MIFFELSRILEVLFRIAKLRFDNNWEKIVYYYEKEFRLKYNSMISIKSFFKTITAKNYFYLLTNFYLIYIINLHTSSHPKSTSQDKNIAAFLEKLFNITSNVGKERMLEFSI